MERARLVIPILVDAWERKLPPFDRAKPVPEKLPNWVVPGSVEHALFLFLGCTWMRGRINSAVAFKQFAALCEKEPWLLDPDVFKVEGFAFLRLRQRVWKLFKENGLGFGAKENSRFYVFNIRKLAIFWDGDPRNVIKSASSYEDLCKVFMAKKDPNSPLGFLGYREKMVSMVLYFFILAGLIDPKEHPGPVDFHNDRLALSTRMVWADDMSPGTTFTFEELGDAVRELYREIVPGVDETIALANAMWYLSRAFCQTNLGNGSHTGKKYRARDTEIRPKKVSWTKSRINNYNSTCGLCPIEEYCSLSIPSAENYNQGKITIRGQRPKPHEHQHVLMHVPRELKPRPPKQDKPPEPEEIAHPSLFD